MGRDAHLRVAQLTENKCSQHFADAAEGERIRFVQFLVAHPILLRNGRTLVPLFIILVAIRTICARD